MVYEPEGIYELYLACYCSAGLNMCYLHIVLFAIWSLWLCHCMAGMHE